MTHARHDGVGAPARRTVVMGALGAVGAAASAPFWAAPAQAATPAVAPVAAAAGTATRYLWPDRTPVVTKDLFIYDAPETTAYSYVVDKRLPAVNSFTVGAVLPTGRLYGPGFNAGRAGLFVVDQARGQTPYFASNADDPWSTADAGQLLTLGNRLVLVTRNYESGTWRTRVYHLLGEGKVPALIFNSTDPALGTGAGDTRYPRLAIGRDERGREAVFLHGDTATGTRQWTVPIDGSAPTQVDRALGVVSRPTLGGVLRWSNDGAGGRALQLFAPNGSSQTQLRLPQGSDAFSNPFHASQDRRQISFDDPDGGTVVLDLALKRAWRITFERQRDYVDGAFGGRRLVFAISQSGDHGLFVQNGIWSFDAATGELARIKDSLKVNMGAYANGSVAGWDHSKNEGSVNRTWVRSVRFND